MHSGINAPAQGEMPPDPQPDDADEDDEHPRDDLHSRILPDLTISLRVPVVNVDHLWRRAEDLVVLHRGERLRSDFRGVSLSLSVPDPALDPYPASGVVIPDDPKGFLVVPKGI